ncbi:MAG: ABC transporter ATP-binding protein/permease [Bacilli bacterium]|nr:ABC transporter ATP-binding protein/permease [Bacilli bacterium]
MKLLNVNKYFNKGKSNELHVLNNISVDFPETGLVAIMGQSGSGKTTLLNALCGLDKINSGEIVVSEYTISKYKTRIWDKLRNQEFGYIFQNYNIFEERTVYENVSLSLEFLGMRDKGEIKHRVMQALEMVGMDKYRNRLAGALSGGEMQRVAIARALVKDPTIMIADEPTGNLDEKNTIMIMNILKKIARDRLVILVTHEKEIGEFYADTIIRIQDGKVVDITTGSNNELKLYADNTIYLQDLNKDAINSNKITLASYYSDKFDATVNLEVILEGNDIIIKASSPDKKIKYATNDSNISIVDGKRPQLTKEEIDKNISDVNEIDHLDKSKLSCRYNIGIFNHIKKGFQRVFDLSKFKKLFLLGFAISACLLVLSVSAYVGVQSVDETDFLRYDRNLIAIEYRNMDNIKSKYNALLNLKQEGKIDNIYPYFTTESPMVNYHSFDKISSYQKGYNLDATYIPYNIVNNYHYTIPNQGEIVIDRFLAKKIYSMSLSTGNTIQNDELLKLTTVTFGNKEYKIVGISEENNGVVYINPADVDAFYIPNYAIYNGEAAWINSLNNGQVVIAGPYVDEEVGDICQLNGSTYTLAGKIIDHNLTTQIFYLTKEDLEYEAFYQSFIYTHTILVSSSIKVKELKNEMDSNEVRNVDKRYTIDYKNAASEKLLIARILLILAAVTIVGPLIFLFFLMRSNLISRVKEVGVYRALGLTKVSILKMHASEALAISATGTLAGWLLGLLIIIKLRQIEFARMIFSGNPLIIGGCLIVCVLINLVVGCIPILVMLRKTPQQILSKYDI